MDSTAVLHIPAELVDIVTCSSLVSLTYKHGYIPVTIAYMMLLSVDGCQCVQGQANAASFKQELETDKLYARCLQEMLGSL